MAEKFNDAVSVFPDRLKNLLEMIPQSIKQETYEIRIRSEKPLVLFGSYGTAFVAENSIISHIDAKNSAKVTDSELDAIVSAVCGYSVYSHQTDMTNGFVTYGSGNRVGFCGTAVIGTNKSVNSISNITSVNIRIARDIHNAADEILKKIFALSCPRGVIIAGAPCSGKTTVLKSLTEVLSSEYKYGFRKCTVIDERFEMSSIRGINCDIVSGYTKIAGITHAIRTLSPQTVICDEITSESEAEQIIKGLYSGVDFIVSVHADSKRELFCRSISEKLINSGGFDFAVILDGSEKPCTVSEIINLKEQYYETFSGNNDTIKFIAGSGSNNYKRKATL